MPSPEPEKDETAPAQPKSPTAPQKTSPARSTPNGTAIRKPGVKPRTPANAPIHKRPPSKKSEPTLLTDFLLGRPSASRQRRRSLDAVKAEMRESTVNRIQKPGGVHDRVKQWQKASAAAAIEEVDDPESELDEIIVEVEEESVVGPSVVTEDNRLHVRNQNTRPGRRKNRDPENWAAEVRSKSAPRKRVISDDHWVMNKTKASPKKKDIKVTMRAIPKDFLQQTAANPKLESKIADWVKRTEAESGGHGAAQPTSRTSKIPQQSTRGESKGKMRAKSLGEIIVEIEEEEEEPTRKPSKNRMKVESRSTPSSRKNSNNGSKESLVSSSKGKHTPKSEPSRTPANDGIRVKACGPNGRWEDGIRVKPVQARWRAPEAKKQSSGGNPFLDGISLKPTTVQKDGKQTPLRPEISDEHSHKRKSSEKHIKPLKETERKGMNDHSDGDLDDTNVETPTRRSPSSRKQRRKSRSPSPSVDGIPFGDSAFSTLDLPIGAEAGNTGNKPKPQRNPSHLVPKVLKRVYNEGKKIMHDTHDAPEMPPRGGVNRPPTIESWLNSTPDPFLDVPSPVSTPALTEVSTEIDDSERRTPKPDQDQKQALEEERRGTGSRQKRVRKTSDTSFRSHNDKSPLGRVLDDPIEFKKPPTPPAAGLRRSPALRAASPPVIKAAKKSPFKDALLDAFRGESTFEGIIDTEDDGDHEKENHDVDDIKNSGRSLQTSENTNSQRSRSSGTHLQVPDAHRDISDRPRRKRRGGSSGNHHLSKIASVETFSTLSSVDTSSNLTKTTLTQATTETGRSDSNVSRRRSNRSGLKRRLTKHSDLVSMLSLPDAPPAGRTKSIRSARSVRTARSSLETATELDLMRELAGDEVKYMRELKTLVDGVIPVLLTCVLSKSDSAIAAGLFNPDSTDMNETFLTKPIVDMGVALERLKSLHRRIPLQDPDALIVWLQRAHRTYQDYTRAWRLGFQDVVVNLAPASRKSSTEEKESPLDSVPRNADGDIVNSNGERVDVAFLLKRPLVRIKYLAKLTKGLDKLNHSELSGKALKIFEDLQETARRRVKEEHARLEDLYANNTDATRARNPQTLAPVEDAHIDRTRQVSAKDFFDLDFPHSNGQRIECRVELILRDNLSDEIDPGDVLICASEITPEATHRYLLFPPIDRDFISACAGEKPDELIIMIRGIQRPIEWRESLLLKGAEPETAAEWIEMLGSIPMPHPVLSSIPDNADTVSMMSMDPSEISEAGDPDDNELPIGARRRRRKHHSKERPRSSTFSTMSSVEIPAPLKIDRKETSSPPRRHRDVSHDEITGQPSRRHSKSSRYHSHTRTRSTPSSPLSSQLVLNDSDEESRDNDDFEESESRASTPGRTSRRPLTPSEELPYIPKVRKTSSAASIDSESTTKDYIRRTSYDPVDLDDTSERSRSPDFAEEESAPPPPPAHRSMSPSGLKQPIIIEPPAPRSRSRRTSSPLKHEYRPSDISDISERSERSEVSVSEVSEMSYSSSEESDTEEEESSSSSDEDELDELDELEAADLPEAEPAPTIYGRRAISPTTSLYSLPNVTLAPVNSTPRIPIVPKVDNSDIRRHVATVTTWNNAKGRWDDVHSKSCSIVIRPGLIEVHEMSSRHSSPAVLSTIQESVVGGSEETSSNEDKRPLLGQVLTPVVTLRQSNSLDIEIHSPPTSDSRVKCSPTIRYHSLHNRACVDLYNSIHQARMNNPTYKKLEEERLLNSYGGATYETAVASKKRSFLSFGRKKSYRASTRAPSVVNSEQSSSPSTSRLSESFKRLTGSSFFNIAKSSIESGRGSSPSSLYTSSSGLAPPQTPHPASLAGTSTSYGGVNLTSENIKIRLYYLETRSKWQDCGNARLTVTAPPPGMRQACAVDQGIERRILVTRKPMKAEDPDEKVEVLLDVVLGANCFSMIGNKGVTCNVWEDVVGPNGEVGMVGPIGRVSGRTRKWCLQAGSVPEASWIYSLVGVGR
ncbi:uncharacterized protein Bfra_005252 [Botrytis fragariae]|uniref:DH domain-containing protein n=1 Tax=Botrytis fragariae TaxID=1964551 RepID=A0A8H6AUE5_9HELO|nr:uncharacterized protein Bfra_005252 [Botrytis fragariae]KAF5873786.1 hypothetical protein Bfra_005252 [Botrytis fragariae]